ncbi:MAG: hypothetical protein S4CHLAM7_00350 [Chlamydiae bacterium]|nr:hypothetical protein [Chlamydiota bacterium]
MMNLLETYRFQPGTNINCISYYAGDHPRDWKKEHLTTSKVANRLFNHLKSSDCLVVQHCELPFTLQINIETTSKDNPLLLQSFKCNRENDFLDIFSQLLLTLNNPFEITYNDGFSERKPEKHSGNSPAIELENADQWKIRLLTPDPILAR